MFLISTKRGQWFTAADTHQIRKDWAGGRCPLCLFSPVVILGFANGLSQIGPEKERALSTAERGVEWEIGPAELAGTWSGRTQPWTLFPSVPGTMVGWESSRGLR